MIKKHPVLTAISLFLALILLAILITGAVILVHGGGSAGHSPFLLVLGTTVEGTEPSPMLRDRINAAYDYLIGHPDVTCIVSGYVGANAQISEAECMYRELVARGIAPERIWLEPNATSTIENFEYTLALIRERTGTTPACLGVLSSEFHLLRASMFAQELGIEIFTVPAKTSDPAGFLYWFLREIIMVWYYAIF